MHHVFGTFCLRPSNGSHLSTEKGTNSWTPVMRDSWGPASAVSLQSCFPFPNIMCNRSLWPNRFFGSYPFLWLSSCCFSSQNYGMIAAQNAFFATLESCLFSHKWLFQELYFSVKFFFIASVRGLLSSMCNSHLKGSIWWLLWLLSQIRLLLDWIITCLRTGWNS